MYLVFEARWSEVEWMIKKNINKKVGPTQETDENSFVSFNMNLSKSNFSMISEKILNVK